MIILQPMVGFTWENPLEIAHDLHETTALTHEVRVSRSAFADPRDGNVAESLSYVAVQPPREQW